MPRDAHFGIPNYAISHYTREEFTNIAAAKAYVKEANEPSRLYTEEWYTPVILTLHRVEHEAYVRIEKPRFTK